MNPIDMLATQTQDAYGWTNKLITSIPHDQWDTTPELLETNVSWQVGHLIMSLYYHSILVIAGHQRDILQQVPLRDYDALFTDAPPRNAVGKTNPQALQQQMMLMEQTSIDIIRSVSPKDLESPLEPTPTPHPVAKTKWEALDWNIKHTMWHCGQLGILKRMVHERFDFGLRRAR